MKGRSHHEHLFPIYNLWVESQLAKARPGYVREHLRIRRPSLPSVSSCIALLPAWSFWAGATRTATLFSDFLRCCLNSAARNSTLWERLLGALNGESNFVRRHVRVCARVRLGIPIITFLWHREQTAALRFFLTWNLAGFLLLRLWDISVTFTFRVHSTLPVENEAYFQEFCFFSIFIF